MACWTNPQLADQFAVQRGAFLGREPGFSAHPPAMTNSRLPCGSGLFRWRRQLRLEALRLAIEFVAVAFDLGPDLVGDDRAADRIMLVVVVVRDRDPSTFAGLYVLQQFPPAVNDDNTVTRDRCLVFEIGGGATTTPWCCAIGANAGLRALIPDPDESADEDVDPADGMEVFRSEYRVRPGWSVCAPMLRPMGTLLTTPSGKA